jgi:acetyl esterase/lipase
MSQKVESKLTDYKEDERLSKETKQFLKKLNTPGSPPLETLLPTEARKVLSDAQASVEVDLSGISESEKTITSEGYTVKLNIVRPAGTEGKLPVFLFLHGGGWVLGDYPTHKRMVRDLVVLSGCASVFINYTPTPDAKYPQAINEIYAAAKWVAENGSEINVDSKKIAVVGNSVGGNMSAVLCIMAKEKGGPEIKFQGLLWPLTNYDFETESYREFGEDRFLTTSLMKWMFDMYSTNPEELKGIYISPLRADIEKLKGLPPALVITAESDVLCDEGEAYARKLDEAGVKVTGVRYKGMIHDFGLLNPLAELPQVKSLFVYMAAEIKKHLS